MSVDTIKTNPNPEEAKHSSSDSNSISDGDRNEKSEVNLEPEQVETTGLSATQSRDVSSASKRKSQNSQSEAQIPSKKAKVIAEDLQVFPKPKETSSESLRRASNEAVIMKLNVDEWCTKEDSVDFVFSKPGTCNVCASVALYSKCALRRLGFVHLLLPFIVDLKSTKVFEQKSKTAKKRVKDKFFKKVESSDESNDEVEQVLVN